MLLARQLPWTSLVAFCHVLRLNLQAGLTLRDAFRQLTARGPANLRPVAEEVRQRLERGDSLRAALKPQRAAFPPPLLALAPRGEGAGRPEVMEGLEDYFQERLRLARQLRQRALGPLVQFVIAVGILAVLLFVLGALAPARGGEPPTLLGLRGGAGAVQLLMIAG